MSAEAIPRMYLESIEVENMIAPLIYCPSPINPGQYMPVNKQRWQGRLRLTISMDYTDGAKSILDKMQKPGGFNFAEERQEWRCVHCGVPNPINNRWCSQCGGPRGWLM